jgi:hypothetical protein
MMLSRLLVRRLPLRSLSRPFASLPHGVTQHVAESGKPYFYNSVRPFASLPPGVTQHVAEGGKPYYYNSVTGETSWTAPTIVHSGFTPALPKGTEEPVLSPSELEGLKAVEKKAIWLSTYMIHNANNIRPSVDGIKVGGHQASSTSLSTILTYLYMRSMHPQDRCAVKPHAGPV